jgi:hypothetical protein
VDWTDRTCVCMFLSSVVWRDWLYEMIQSTHRTYCTARFVYLPSSLLGDEKARGTVQYQIRDPAIRAVGSSSEIWSKHVLTVLTVRSTGREYWTGRYCTILYDTSILRPWLPPPAAWAFPDPPIRRGWRSRLPLCSLDSLCVSTFPYPHHHLRVLVLVLVLVLSFPEPQREREGERERERAL